MFSYVSSQIFILRRHTLPLGYELRVCLGRALLLSATVFFPVFTFRTDEEELGGVHRPMVVVERYTHTYTRVYAWKSDESTVNTSNRLDEPTNLRTPSCSSPAGL